MAITDLYVASKQKRNTITKAMVRADEDAAAKRAAHHNNLVQGKNARHICLIHGTPILQYGYTRPGCFKCYFQAQRDHRKGAPAATRAERGRG